MQQFVKIASAFFSQKLPVISPLMNFRNLNDSGNENILRSFCQSYLGDRLDEFNYNQLHTVLSLISSNIINNGYAFKDNKLYARYNIDYSITNVFYYPIKYPNEDIKKLYLTALCLAQEFFTFAGSEFIDNYADNLDKKDDELIQIMHAIKAIEDEIQLYEFDHALFIAQYPEYQQLINLITWCKTLYKENRSNYNTDGDIDAFRSCIIVPDILYHNSEYLDFFWDLNEGCYIDDLLVELNENLSMDIYPMALCYLCNEIERKHATIVNAKKSDCSVHQ